MESTAKPRKRRHVVTSSNGSPARVALAPATIKALTDEHERFLRFVRVRVGNHGEAEDLVQNSLLRALQRGGGLRRGERAVAWFYRILRNAIADHFRRKQTEHARTERLLSEMRAAGTDRAMPPPDWDAAVSACFLGLLPALKPRYAEVLQRIDLQGELKVAVARELKMSATTMDVVLHRARGALRKHLELFCGACSREQCLACACALRERTRSKN